MKKEVGQRLKRGMMLAALSVGWCMYQLMTGTLCTLNPSQEAILDVCRRIDITDNQEVGKEAARSIRRELKNGNEGERAVAVKIWYITMKSVSVKGYRRGLS